MSILGSREKSRTDALEAVRAQKIVFSICMGLVVILARENPLLIFPNVLWAFLLLLVFNLAYHTYLERYGRKWQVPLVSVAVNSLIISLILAYSGGSHSFFWPMYLLPIFTACLYLEGRHVALAVLIPAGFLSCFYIEGLWVLDASVGAELAIKLGVLALSAGVTMRVSFQERKSRGALEKARSELDGLLRSFAESEKKARTASKWTTVGEVLGGVMHDINNPLTVILGSVQLLLLETPKDAPIRSDLERVETAAMKCCRLAGTLTDWARSDDRPAPVADLKPLLSQILSLMDYHVKVKRLNFVEDCPDGLPALKMSQEQVRQAFVALLVRASEKAAQGTSLELKALARDGGVGVNLRYKSRGAGDPMEGLQGCRDLLSSCGGALAARVLDDGAEYLVHLPV